MGEAILPLSDVLWVGGIGGVEADLVKRAGVSFEAVPAAGVHGVGLKALPGNLLRLARGFWQSRRILSTFRPDVLFFTGGYVAVPMAVAGALAGRHVPAVVYVPDIEPGLALKFLIRFAERVALTVEDSRTYLPARSQVVITGYPTRPDLKTWQREAAQQALHLEPGLPALLVMGGSKGARSINRALLAVLPQLLAEMQVVHISGSLDWPEVQANQVRLSGESAALAARYHAYPYLHEEMGAALAAADLVVTRAGASALGELPLFGLPGVLVPYPHAWRYQRVNAEYLAGRKAAVLLADEDLSDRLLPLVLDLMRDGDRRQQMRQALQGLARPDAAAKISRLLQTVASGQSQKRK